MTLLQIWDCNGGSAPDEVWQFTLAGQIQYAADTEKCVKLRDGSTQNGTPVQIFDCNGTSGQTWQFVQGGGVQGFQLQDGNGACLSAPSATVGAGLVLEPCNATGANQTFYADGHGSIYFGSQNGPAVTLPNLTSAAPGFVPETQIQLQNWDGAPNGEFQLDSAHNLIAAGVACVEARDGAASSGTVVQAYNCNGTTGQTWFARPVGATCPGAVVPDAADGTCEACGGSNGANCCTGSAPPCAGGLTCMTSSSTCTSYYLCRVVAGGDQCLWCYDKIECNTQVAPVGCHYGAC
jgi:alpha-glucosidase